MSKFNQLVEQTYSKINEAGESPISSSQFDPRGNKADISNRPVADYSEPMDNTLATKREEQNAGLGLADKDDNDRFNPLHYAFKNDIIERKGKAFWVFAGPDVDSSKNYYRDESGKQHRKENTSVKYKNITDLIDPSKPLEGQEFQGKFNRFKIVRIESSEHRKRNEQRPSSIMGAFYKAIAV